MDFGELRRVEHLEPVCGEGEWDCRWDFGVGCGGACPKAADAADVVLWGNVEILHRLVQGEVFPVVGEVVARGGNACVHLNVLLCVLSCE